MWVVVLLLGQSSLPRRRIERERVGVGYVLRPRDRWCRLRLRGCVGGVGRRVLVSELVSGEEAILRVRIRGVRIDLVSMVSWRVK